MSSMQPSSSAPKGDAIVDEGFIEPIERLHRARREVPMSSMQPSSSPSRGVAIVDERFIERVEGDRYRR
jgi:hypothetical protein